MGSFEFWGVDPLAAAKVILARRPKDGPPHASESEIEKEFKEGGGVLHARKRMRHILVQAIDRCTADHGLMMFTHLGPEICFALEAEMISRGEVSQEQADAVRANAIAKKRANDRRRREKMKIMAAASPEIPESEAVEAEKEENQ
jgi:hypothetical protein